MKKNIVNLVLFILICAFVYSGYYIYDYINDKRINDRTTSEVIDISKGSVINSELPDSEAKSGKDLARFKYGINFAELNKVNPDTFGWIRNQGFINYPVVKSKDGQDYLKKDFNGNYNPVGTIFTLDQTRESDDNISLYGHVMGVYRTDAFSTIHNYRESEYLEDFNKFQFLTPNHVRDFEVFALFEIDIVKDEFNPFVSNFISPKESKAFYDNIVKKSEIPVNHEYKETNRYMTLMTCLRGARDIDDRLIMILIER